MRLLVTLGFYGYLAYDWASHGAVLSTHGQMASVLIIGVSLALLIAPLVDLRESVLRRSLGLLHDVCTITYLMAVSGESTAPLVAAYLWVTLGNGFRYGPAYLYAASAASATGFVLVYLTNPFWGAHAPLWTGIWLMLVVVPLYAGKLLAQLHSALRRERAASQAKSGFLANMSHELRTPLNGVIGVSDLLVETPLNREQKELAGIIRASADTLLELIDNVLDISRIEAGKLTLSREDFDLHRLVLGLISMLSPQAELKGLRLSAHISPAVEFSLRGDARHLRQVLLNLLGNALKFTERGRIDVWVSVAGEASNGDQLLRFEVVDTGVGVPADAQSRIFESFSQADSSITRRFGGTGLGTAIARQLVEAMGGKIGLCSAEGEGSTFWFEIPFGRVPASAPNSLVAHPRVAVLANIAESFELRTAVISLGGDATLLHAGHFELASLASLGMATGSTFDAVLADPEKLPGGPAAFFAMFERDPGVCPLPVILVGAAGAPIPPEVRDAAFRAGCVAALDWPADPLHLYRSLRLATLQQLGTRAQETLAERFAAGNGGQRKALRILVAEDNPVNQRVIRGLLEHAGHEVYLADDGEMALAMLEAGEVPYDLAIVDMHMPGYSGPEVVQRWRFMEPGHLPMVMLTADARNSAMDACLRAGADAFLTKPVNSRELMDVLARFAPTPAEGQPSAAEPAPSMPDPGALQVLDIQVLDELVRVGGRDLVLPVITSFQEEAAHILEGAAEALAARNQRLWHDQLHMLKGGAGDVGAARLRQACVEIERMSADELAQPGAASGLNRVRSALAESIEALSAYARRFTLAAAS